MEFFKNSQKTCSQNFVNIFFHTNLIFSVNISVFRVIKYYMMLWRCETSLWLNDSLWLNWLLASMNDSFRWWVHLIHWQISLITSLDIWIRTIIVGAKWRLQDYKTFSSSISWMFLIIIILKPNLGKKYLGNMLWFGVFLVKLWTYTNILHKWYYNWILILNDQ